MNISRVASRAALLASVSFLVAPAMAAVTDYPNGSTNGGAIVLTDNTTQLQVLTGSATQSGAISQSGGSFGLAKIGSGTLVLTAANTYSGITAISAGTLSLSGSGTLGTGAVTNSGTLRAATSLTAANAITFNAGTDSTISAAAGAAFSLTGNLTFNTGTGNTVYFGSVTDTGTVNISPTTVTVGANAGPLEIVGGTLKDISTTTPQSSFATALGKFSSVTIDSGATLEIDSNGNGRSSSTETYIKLFGSGQLVIGGSNQPRIVLGNSTFAGQISGASTGYVGIGGVSQGTAPSTVILTGDNNAALEFQIAANSVLQIGNGGTTGSLTSGSKVVAFSSSAGTPLLRFNRSDNITLGSGLEGSFVLQQAGSGILTISGNNSFYPPGFFSGSVRVTSGGLSISSNNNLNGASIALSDATTLYATASAGYTSPVTIAGAPTFSVASGTTATWSGQISNGASTGALTLAGGGTLILTVDEAYSGGTTVSAGTLQVGNGGSVGSISGNVADNAALAFSRSDAVTFSGVISGSGTLTKLASNTLTLTGTNTYSGGTTISAGTLQIGNGGTTGSVSGNITDNGALVFNRSDNITYAGTVSGTGSLTKTGSGTLTLSGANTYSGGTTISAGTLLLSSDTILQASGSSLTFDGGTLKFGGTFNLTGTFNVGVTGPRTIKINSGGGIVDTNGFNTSMGQGLSGSGGLTKNGAGILFLNGTNTYTGGTTVNAGSLLTASLASTGPITINGGTLDFAPSAPLSLTVGPLSGAGGTLALDSTSLTTNSTITTVLASDIISNGSLILTGGGTLILTGNAAHSGGTTVTAGTLQIGNGGTAGALTGSIVDNATLTFNRSDAASYAGVISGSGRLTKLAANTLTLTGANTYSGGTTISAGTLQIGSGGTTGSITGNVTDNGSLLFNRSDSIAFGGVISGSGSLVQAGSGTLGLTGTNTYTGGTTVTAGALNLGISTATAKIAGAVTLNGTEATVPTLNVNFADVSGVTGITNITGLVQFNNASSAGNMTLVNAGPAGGSASFYYVTAFSNTSSAGTATINTGNDGGVFLQDTATLGTAKVTNTGILSTTGIQAAVLVLRSSSPLTTPVIVNNSAGITFAQNNSNLGQASITNNANGLLLVATGQSTGATAPNAGSATIVNNNGGITSFSLPGGHNAVTFGMLLVGSDIDVSNDTGTAASATITNNSGGITYFFSKTSGGAATIINNAGGVLDISGLTSGGTTLGKLSGAGSVFLGANTLTLTGNADATISGVIASTGGIAGGTGGGLVKQGTGTLTLSGTNTYAGGTTVSSGTLIIGDGGTSGSITGNVIDNSALAFNRSDTITFGGVISGTGSVTQAGSGTTILTGANTYSGGTFVTGGTLRLGTGGSVGSGTITVTGGTFDAGSQTLNSGNLTGSGGTITLGSGGLLFNMVGNQTLGSVLTGSGGIIKSGTGTLTLTGNNSFSGGITIAQGTVSLGNSNAAGAGTITTTGSVIDYANGDVIANPIVIASNTTQLQVLTGAATQAGVISESGGSRPMEKIGSGVLILTGANTYTGNTTITAGTLQVGNGGTSGSLAGIVVDNSTLIFNRSDAITFAGVISGIGSLTKSGTGSLVLTGASTYAGATAVSSGTLSVNGSIASSSGVTVASGATLGGSGTVAAITLQSGATLAPGNSIGTITTTSASFTSNSIYQIEVSASGQSDLVNATGTVTLNGTAQVLAGPGTYAPITTYRILNAGSISGSFSSLTSSLTNLTPTLTYSTGAVDLRLIRNDVQFGAYGNAANQIAAGSAVSAGGANSALYLALANAYAPATIGATLDSLSGEIHASLRTAMIEDSRLIRDTVLDRLAGGGTGLWVQGFADSGALNSDGNAAELHRNNAGFIAGFDLPVGGGFRAGVAGSYGGHSLGLAARASHASSNGGAIVGYAGWQGGAWHVDLGGDYGWGSDSTTRSLAALSETESSSQDTHSAQIFARVAYALSDLPVTPYLGLTHVLATTGAFAETGGPARLSGAERGDSQTFTALGLRMATPELDLGSMPLHLHADLGWSHALEGRTTGQIVSFATGQSFSVLGAPIGANAATVQAGLDLAIAPSAGFTIGYDASLSSHGSSHAVRGGLEWRM